MGEDVGEAVGESVGDTVDEVIGVAVSEAVRDAVSEFLSIVSNIALLLHQPESSKPSSARGSSSLSCRSSSIVLPFGRDLL